MRIAEIEFIKALSNTQVSNMIPVLEKGLEITKMEYIATRDETLRMGISDSCVFLSFLYFRQMGKLA